MGAPAPGKSSDGRANAAGIFCLYLASDEETAIHEVRVNSYDYVSIGKFVLQQDIVIVDLSSISNISPFIEDIEFTDHALNIPYLRKINTEMSHVLRRSDGKLDYVPTQYLVDLIKSIKNNNKPEYNGIEYASTLHTNGHNLAIFTDNLFKCEEVNVYHINSMCFDKKKLFTFSDL